jgi:hypothetical protein
MRKEDAKGVEEWGKVKRRYKRRRLMTCEDEKGACQGSRRKGKGEKEVQKEKANDL